MVYLAKAKKIDLFEICDEIGVKVNSSSKVEETKKLIFSSDFYEEYEVNIMLERLIEDRKQQEQMARETRQFELDMKKLELSKEDSDQRREPEKRVEFSPRFQLTQITPKFDEKYDEIGLYLINFERGAEMVQVPRTDWVAYLESTRDFKPKPETFQDRQREFDKRKALRCYECGPSNHLRPQCDNLKKTPESISYVVTDKSFDELTARYTSLGKVNGVEIKILRDTGANLDFICNKYVKPHMYTIEKAAVLKDSLDQGRYLLGNKTAALLEYYKTKEDLKMHMINTVQTRTQKKLLEVENNVQGQSIEQFDEELDDNVSKDEEKKNIIEERMHMTFKRILRVLSLEAGADWEKILPNALFALITVIHDTNGFSPTELVHGQNLRTPMMCYMKT
ncbi:SCAN box domain-containing protein [Trichonephila clavata]|uniref:SCAN box domain-containing protein n=1 Tax=Trichonephila clavata TaxID=2740835 RepID=A0A8X6FFX6_TRICU|nr:SCAN box domain-containing protein [Trichonephila clavata]